MFRFVFAFVFFLFVFFCHTHFKSSKNVFGVSCPFLLTHLKLEAQSTLCMLVTVKEIVGFDTIVLVPLLSKLETCIKMEGKFEVAFLLH